MHGVYVLPMHTTTSSFPKTSYALLFPNIALLHRYVQLSFTYGNLSALMFIALYILHCYRQSISELEASYVYMYITNYIHTTHIVRMFCSVFSLSLDMLEHDSMMICLRCLRRALNRIIERRYM